MFDSLKDKLGSFRKDVEETADQKAEPLEDEEDAEAEAESEAEAEVEDAETTAQDVTAGDLEEHPETGASEDVESAVDSQAESDTESPPAPTTGAEPETAFEDERPDTPGGTDVADSSVDDRGAVDTDPDVEGTVSEGEGVSEETVDEDEVDEDEEADDTNSTGFGRKAKSLVRGKFVIEEDDLEGPLQELELALLSSDVELGVTEEILENIEDELVGETRRFTESTGSVVEEALGDAILDVISVGQFDFDQHIAEADKPLVIIFTGVNGVGKTTSIAKLSKYFEERGFSSVMANGDTYRAGANEQIREHAEARGTKLIAHQQGGDPAAVLYDAVEYAEANDVDIVLGDTAGRLHTDEGLMDQLEKIERVVDPDMTVFVDEAVAGQDAVNRAREFNESAPFDGAILTKADADSNGGAAISVAHVTGKPILFLGVGQGYDHLERFDPERMVDRLLEVEE